MKISSHSPQPAAAFTLVEMVGVLAIIAILASLLVPKVFAAIDEARFNNAVLSINGVRTATLMYFTRYGYFGDVGGAAIASSSGTTNWDMVLLQEGLLERRFGVKVGTGGYLNLTNSTESFNLDGTGTNNDCAGCQWIVECVLTGVTLGDAYQLSQRIDGPSPLSVGPTNTSCAVGRVNYFPRGSLEEVHIYIAHK